MKDNIIGTPVRYFDYIGSERFGRIVAIEPYLLGPDQVYVYIEDEETEFNIHDIIVDNKVIKIKYSELRLSSEVYIDEK